MYNTKMVDDLIAIGRHIAGDKWDQSFEFQLNGLKKIMNESNIRSDFQLLIGGISEPDHNDLHKKIEGHRLINAFTWDNIDDVPKNLAVFDKEGDLWQFRDGKWKMITVNTDPNEDNVWVAADEIDRRSYDPWTVFYNFKD